MPADASNIRQPIIVTHPANTELLRREILANKFEENLAMPLRFHTWEIVEDPDLDRDQPSGYYILPNGRRVERHFVCVGTRWVNYGPDDIDFLLYAGIIEEEREPVFYLMDSSKTLNWYMTIPMPLITVRPTLTNVTV